MTEEHEKNAEEHQASNNESVGKIRASSKVVRGKDGIYRTIDEVKDSPALQSSIYSQGGARGVTTVSSSSGVGRDVAAKRLNLVNSKSEPQIGRREPPEPYDPWPRRKMYIRGLTVGFIVVVLVFILVLFLAPSQSTLG